MSGCILHEAIAMSLHSVGLFTILLHIAYQYTRDVFKKNMLDAKARHPQVQAESTTLTERIIKLDVGKH